MFDSDSLRKKLAEKLLDSSSSMPTSSLGRFGKTALTGARTGKLLMGKKLTGLFSKAAPGDELDIDALMKIVGSIGQLKGLMMKMGQIMSYIDVALPEELSAALSVLQTQSQPMPIERVKDIISADLGDAAAALLKNIEARPMAAASIGQVHKSVIDGTPVAVKVQYPEIAKAIVSDLAPTATVTKIVSVLFPHFRMADIIAEMRQRLLEECDYVHEAEAQQTFAKLFAHHHRIIVPKVHTRFCSEHVLTSTWVNGISFEEFLAANPPQELRNDIGKALFEFYIGSLFRHNLYNCDPHPGNYLFLEDNTIAMLDYGCTRAFDGDFVRQLAAFTRAVHEDTPQGLHKACLDIGLVKEGQKYDFNTARDLIRGFYGAMLIDSEQKIELGSMSMKEVAEKKMEWVKRALPGEFLFLLRIRVGLMSVLAKLGAVANWRQLEAECIAAAK